MKEIQDDCNVKIYEALRHFSPIIFMWERIQRLLFLKIVILLETSNSQLEIYLPMRTYNIYYVCMYMYIFFFWKIVARRVDFPVPNEVFIS